LLDCSLFSSATKTKAEQTSPLFGSFHRQIEQLLLALDERLIIGAAKPHKKFVISPLIPPHSKMKFASSTTTCLLALGIASLASAQSTGACVETINDIALRESLVTDTSLLRTYTLCSQITHQIGTLDLNYDLVDGQVMLPLRPNMKIQCGADGKKENNCLITGGDIQVDGTSRFGIGADVPLDNIDFQGITFQGSSQYSVWLTRPGSVTFTDCVFRVSSFCF
jgi:hypothetical protein